MTAEIIPFDPRPPKIVRVEITSPGTLRDGRRYYLVDYIAADGCRCGMWDGTDIMEALEAAAHCANDEMPIVDLVGAGLRRH